LQSNGEAAVDSRNVRHAGGRYSEKGETQSLEVLGILLLAVDTRQRHTGGDLVRSEEKGERRETTHEKGEGDQNSSRRSLCFLSGRFGVWIARHKEVLVRRGRKGGPKGERDKEELGRLEEEGAGKANPSTISMPGVFPSRKTRREKRHRAREEGGGKKL